MEDATISAILDPAEVAYLEHRRRLRRRQVLVFAILASLAFGFGVWKVARHFTAAWWLAANHYVVLWGAQKDDWKSGGSTIVRYSSRNHLFSSERPVFDLKFLTDLHRIVELDLSTLVGIRDADLDHLDRLGDLTRLSLDRSHHPYWIKERNKRLTDATVARIGRLTRLAELDLGGQEVTDAGLNHLAGLDQLRSIDLVDTEITDAGLEVLKLLPALKSLDLTGTKVTARGVAAFEASRPDVRVVDSVSPRAPPAKAPP